MLATAVFLVTRPSGGPAGGAAIGGPFSLISEDGREVTERDFAGGPILVFFGYTHCPDVCPTTLFDLSEVLKAVGADKKVAGLFVTVDPARDTPGVLKEYLAAFDPRIRGLSGDDGRIAAVEKAFRVYAKKVPQDNGGYTMDHTALIYLMDKQGRFVSSFNLDRPPAEAAKELARYL